MEAIAAFIIEIAGKYPVMASILFIIGLLRLVFKPLVSIAQAYVAYTPKLEDDAALNKFMEGRIYKAIVWFVDFFGSIKLPAKV